ncbi:hypothetical protein DID99_34320 [Burkholderia sp. Bp8986]|nr:hypothetical protein DID99_34320 [Burkholderia sp. Bp8986]
MGKIANNLAFEDLKSLTLVGCKWIAHAIGDVWNSRKAIKLAGKLLQLPDIAHREDFTVLLDTIETLPQAQQTAPMAALAGAHQWFSSTNAAYVPDWLTMIKVLPEAQQTALLVALANNVLMLPTHRLGEGFARLFSTIKALPETYRGAPLTALASNIWALPSTQGEEIFTDLLAVIEMLPQAQQSALLTALASNVPTLPTDRLEAGLTMLFAKIEVLSQELQGAPLTTLTGALLWLSPTGEAATQLVFVWDRIQRRCVTQS